LIEFASSSLSFNTNGFPTEFLALIQALGTIGNNHQISIFRTFECGNTTAKPTGGEGMGFINKYRIPSLV
jgi:hypothetical protein